MDGNGRESKDFYGILGVKKECSEAEIKIAYRKLALRWHPDRCSASGNSKDVEEANKKFQALQEAYSVLSDANRRFLYDVGIHDNDDDDENGMADFLSEMATMMRQNKSNESVETSFEELKDLFEEMFENDIKSFGSSSETNGFTFTTCPPLFSSYGENLTSVNKRGSSGMSTTMFEDHSTFKLNVQGFSLGTNNMEEMRRGSCARERRGTRPVSKHRSCRKGCSSARD